jgi:hypothetical protein
MNCSTTARTEADSKEHTTTAHLPNCLVASYAFWCRAVPKGRCALWDDSSRLGFGGFHDFTNSVFSPTDISFWLDVDVLFFVADHGYLESWLVV